MKTGRIYTTCVDLLCESIEQLDLSNTGTVIPAGEAVLVIHLRPICAKRALAWDHWFGVDEDAGVHECYLLTSLGHVVKRPIPDDVVYTGVDANETRWFIDP